MWIDTHCHLDADEFDVDRDAVVARARAAGVSMVVIPPGHVDHFQKAAQVAHEYRFAYALGLHPLWIDRPTFPMTYFLTVFAHNSAATFVTCACSTSQSKMAA